MTLIVSQGTDLAEVPDVVGLGQQIAENQIESADLIANVETEDSDQPEGTVTAQDPPAGPRSRPTPRSRSWSPRAPAR